jgi:putative ABC transport system ATP-binding protein
MAFIEVKHVAKMYGTEENPTYALRDVSFSLDSGAFVAIMGPSGSGKSTLLHIMGFLDRHTSGEYRFDGKTINDFSQDELAHVRNKKMGFVFQQYNLLARASVLDNVKLPLLYSGIKKSLWDERAKDRIEEVGLTHRISHTPAQLSGGEKQRVAIARALINNPDVIFADEIYCRAR